MQGSEDYFFRAFFVLKDQDGEGMAAGKHVKAATGKSLKDSMSQAEGHCGTSLQERPHNRIDLQGRVRFPTGGKVHEP